MNPRDRTKKKKLVRETTLILPTAAERLLIKILIVGVGGSSLGEVRPVRKNEFCIG